MDKDLEELSARELKSLIERGIINVTMTTPIPTTRFETPEYKKVAHLRGNGIAISEAGRRYNIHPSNITRWRQRGLIDTVASKGNRILVDEADVAYCVSVRDARGPGQGIWLFDENGLPLPEPMRPRRKLPIAK
jgi:hypothetical protein